MKATLRSTFLILCLILSACDSATPQVVTPQIATATIMPPISTSRPPDTPQSTPTPTAMDTATNEPTAAQTEAATPGPSDTPSATFTITATDTPTETPTSTLTPTRTRRPPTRTSTPTLTPVFLNRPDIQGCNVNYSLGGSLYGHAFIENPAAGPNGLMRIAYFLNGKQVAEDRPLAQAIEIGPLKEGDVIGDANDSHTCLRPTPLPGGGGGGSSGDLDKDGDGYTPNGGDCNDNDPSIYPGAPDPMDPIDQDCDGNPNG